MAGLSLRFQVAGYLLLVAGEVASSHGAPSHPPLPQEGFEVQLLPFSKRHYRLKKAILIKSTAIISGFMMITSLRKGSLEGFFSGRQTKWEYTCKHRAWKKKDSLAPVTLSAQSYLHADKAHAGQ